MEALLAMMAAKQAASSLPQKPNALDSLLGGTSSNPRARNMGLLSAGLSLLASGAPSTQRTSLGQALARAVPAGQQAYGAVADRDKQAALEERRKQIMAKLAPAPNETTQQTYARLQQSLPLLVQTGDIEAVRAVSEVLKSMSGLLKDDSMGSPRILMDDEGNPRYGWILQDGSVKYTDARPVGTGSSGGRLVRVEGEHGPEYVMFDQKTGTSTPTGLRPPEYTGVASELERRASALRPGAEWALSIIDRIGTTDRLSQLATKGGLNELLSANQQQLNIAGETLAEAWLRLTSGAAIKEEEFQMARKMMVPQPGDSPEALRRKAERRKLVVDALRRISERAGSVSVPADIISQFGNTSPRSAGNTSPGSAGNTSPGSAGNSGSLLTPEELDLMDREIAKFKIENGID